MSKQSWLTILLLFLVPILLIFYVGSQSAYSEVADRFSEYQHIPEVSRLSELATVPPEQVVMLRGQIAEADCQPPSMCQSGLLIFQERPTAGREVRYQEEFAQVFPEFTLRLADGPVRIMPSLTRDRVIQHELHQIPDGEITRTGFQAGDTVTVQGQWQPDAATLSEVTGITGADKAGLIAEWQTALQQVYWLRNGLGILSLLGAIVLAIRLRRARSRPPQENEEWPTPTTTATPTA